MGNLEIKNKTPKLIMLLLLFFSLTFFLINGFFAYCDESSGWSRVYRLATDSTTWQPNTGKPDIVIDSLNDIHIVWLSQNEGDGSKQLYYRRFDEKGNLLSIQELSNQSKISEPDIAIDQFGNIIVMWIEENQYLYYFNISSSSDEYNLNSISFNISKPNQFAFQIDKSNIFHIVIREGSPGAYQIRYLNYDPKIKILNYEEVLSGITSCSSPVLLIDSNGKANILFWEYMNGRWDLIYSYFDPITKSIIARVEIGNTVTLKSQNIPSMAVDSNNDIHVVWTSQIEGTRVMSSTVSYSLIYKNRDVIISESLTEEKTGWASISIDSRDTVHMVWTDWREGRMEIYNGIILENESKLLWKEKISNSPSGTWLPSIIIDEDDFSHVFWLEFFKKGVRISYKNMRWSEPTNVITYFMDTYGFMSIGEVIQGLALSIMVSLLLSPIVMLSPSILIVIISLIIVKRISKHIFLARTESIQIKWILFPLTIGLSKLVVLFFKIQFYYSFLYQVYAILVSYGMSFLIQKRRKKSLTKPEDWNSSTFIIGLFDGFLTALPHILAFITGFF